MAGLSDRFDSHSISQESASEHLHNQIGLDELTDEQIQAQIDDVQRVNQMLSLENSIFDKFHRKLEPFLLASIGGGSSTNLSATPSSSTHDLNAGAPPPAGSGAAGSRYRKRSKSRSTQGDYRMRLTADQKCDIATKEIEELKEVQRRAGEDSERNLDSYKAISEEADIRLSEFKIELHEFERDALKAGYDPIKRKIMVEKLIKYFDDRVKERDTLIEKLKLKNTTMRKNMHKLKVELKEKEEMGEVLHEVDFKQLKIENKQYMDKIDEKNNEMIKLKKMVGLATQTLNYRKKLLSQCLKEYETILNEIRTRINILGKLENETEVVNKEHAKEENKNRKIRAQLENYKVPEVNDYVNAEDYLFNLEKEVKVWERKVEIAEMALKINKQTWLQMKNQSVNINVSNNNNKPSYNNNQISNQAF